MAMGKVSTAALNIRLPAREGGTESLGAAVSVTGALEIRIDEERWKEFRLYNLKIVRKSNNILQISKA